MKNLGTFCKYLDIKIIRKCKNGQRTDKIVKESHWNKTIDRGKIEVNLNGFWSMVTKTIQEKTIKLANDCNKEKR